MKVLPDMSGSESHANRDVLDPFCNQNIWQMRVAFNQRGSSEVT